MPPFVRIVLRLQRQSRSLNIALGYAACLDRREHGGHLLGVCFASLARGLFLAADTDADHCGVGWNGDRCLARDCHKFFRCLRRCDCEGGDESKSTENAIAASLHRYKYIDHQFVGSGLHRVGGVLLDEQVFGLKLLVVEIVSDRFIRQIHGVV